VSVVGEYQRIRGDFLAALGTSDGERAEQLTAQLAHADVEVAGSVSEAARRTLDLLTDVTPDTVTGFPTERERKLFVEALEHLLSICHVVLGRT